MHRTCIRVSFVAFTRTGLQGRRIVERLVEISSQLHPLLGVGVFLPIVVCGPGSSAP
jgi:hypothetical protein